MEQTENKKWWQKNVSFGSVSDADILLFTKHLSVALKAGLTIVDALDMLYDQGTGKMKMILGEIMNTVSSGKPLYQALSAHIQGQP